MNYLVFICGKKTLKGFRANQDILQLQNAGRGGITTGCSVLSLSLEAKLSRRQLIRDPRRPNATERIVSDCFFLLIFFILRINLQCCRRGPTHCQAVHFPVLVVRSEVFTLVTGEGDGRYWLDVSDTVRPPSITAGAAVQQTPDFRHCRESRGRAGRPAAALLQNLVSADQNFMESWSGWSWLSLSRGHHGMITTAAVCLSCLLSARNLKKNVPTRCIGLQSPHGQAGTVCWQ